MSIPFPQYYFSCQLVWPSKSRHDKLLIIFCVHFPSILTIIAIYNTNSFTTPIRLHHVDISYQYILIPWIFILWQILNEPCTFIASSLAHQLHEYISSLIFHNSSQLFNSFSRLFTTFHKDYLITYSKTIPIASQGLYFSCILVIIRITTIAITIIINT